MVDFKNEVDSTGLVKSDKTFRFVLFLHTCTVNKVFDGHNNGLSIAERGFGR